MTYMEMKEQYEAIKKENEIVHRMLQEQRQEIFLLKEQIDILNQIKETSKCTIEMLQDTVDKTFNSIKNISAQRINDEISAELFEAVMGEGSTLTRIESRTILYYLDGIHYEISINDLFFKCKEWALQQGYMIVTFGNGYLIYDVEELYDPMEQLHQWLEDGLAENEQQALFNACQWILDKERITNVS